MARRESKSASSNVHLKSDHRRAKAPAHELEHTHTNKRTEKRAQQHWAALVEEETFYIADFGNAV